MEQYVAQCKDLIDLFLVTSEILNDWEQALYVLRDLDANYSSLMTHITNKKHVLGLDELFTKLMTHECQIQIMNLPNPKVIQGNYTRKTSKSQL